MGVCLESDAEVTLVSDDNGGSGGSEVFAVGGVCFVEGKGVGWCGGGGGVVCVVLVFTICGCWMLCTISRS